MAEQRFLGQPGLYTQSRVYLARTSTDRTNPLALFPLATNLYIVGYCFLQHTLAHPGSPSESDQALPVVLRSVCSQGVPSVGRGGLDVLVFPKLV